MYVGWVWPAPAPLSRGEDPSIKSDASSPNASNATAITKTIYSSIADRGKMSPETPKQHVEQAAKPPAEQNGASGPTKRHEEYQYLDLVREILDNGEHRPDRYAGATIGGKEDGVMVVRSNLLF